ncbi:MAG: hypothetical protein KIT45_09850 [Fimbriimonadia bacterium]|nr:hypothetical protein [Fimbriimonadia bacterium]
MQPSVLEGTWEEIMLHAQELAGKRIRLILLSEEEHNQTDSVSPNTPLLKALDEIAQRQQTRRETSTEGSQEILRQAREGGLYGNESG